MSFRQLKKDLQGKIILAGPKKTNHQKNYKLFTNRINSAL